MVVAGGFGDFDFFFVEHAAAVFVAVLVVEALDGDFGFGEVLVWEGGCELEAGFGELDCFEVEGGRAVEGETLEAFGLFTPASDGLADVELLIVG